MAAWNSRYWARMHVTVKSKVGYVWFVVRVKTCRQVGMVFVKEKPQLTVSYEWAAVGFRAAVFKALELCVSFLAETKEEADNCSALIWLSLLPLGKIITDHLKSALWMQFFLLSVVEEVFSSFTLVKALIKQQATSLHTKMTEVLGFVSVINQSDVFNAEKWHYYIFYHCIIIIEALM